MNDDVKGPPFDMEELAREFGGSYRLNRFLFRLEGLISQDGDEALSTEWNQLGSSVQLITGNEDKAPVRSSTRCDGNRNLMDFLSGPLQVDDKTVPEEEKSVEEFDLSDLFARLSGFELINGMKEHSEDAPKLELVFDVQF